MRSLALNLTDAEYSLLGQPEQALSLGELLNRLAEAAANGPDPAASLLLSLLEIKLGLDRPVEELLNELRGTGNA